MTPEEIELVRQSAATLEASGESRAADLAKVYRALLAEIDRLRALRGAALGVIGDAGCSCECDHVAAYEDHEEGCERCLGCRIEQALRGDAA